jgi:hypothetical protein
MMLAKYFPCLNEINNSEKIFKPIHEILDKKIKK